jgi:tetratricopeptide (TPR) repeat protein/Zn-dependent protease
VRLVSLVVVILAVAGVASLAALPIAAKSAAERADFQRPEVLASEPRPLERRDEPLVAVEKLDDALRLPRVDPTATDEHSRASIAAYRRGDYERAFEESVLALDPTPLEDNGLYRVLTTTTFDMDGLSVGGERHAGDLHVEKPNGRMAIRVLDEALAPILEEGGAQTPALLSNAAAMLTLHVYANDPYSSPDDPLRFSMAPWMAKELAHQAASLRPSYCPALLNIALYDGVSHRRVPGVTSTKPDLDHAGYPQLSQVVGGLGDERPGTEYYPVEACDDPALLYYRAQNSMNADLSNLRNDLRQEWVPGGVAGASRTLQMAEQLAERPGWEGLAHSVSGDFYYWLGAAYTSEPFARDYYLENAVGEYENALALQPDDTAIRHGKALAYLELGRADVREEVDEVMLEDAAAEAQAVLDASPQDPALPSQTLVQVREELGGHAAAARLARNVLANEPPPPTPLSLVTHSPISHGSDRYSEFRFFEQAGGGAFVDDEIVRPYELRLYDTSVGDWAEVGALKKHREQLRQFALLRNDLLSGDYAALETDLRGMPAPVQQSKFALLTAATGKVLGQSGDRLADGAEDAIDEAVGTETWGQHSPGEPTFQGRDAFFFEAANLLRQYKRYEDAARVYAFWRTELEVSDAGDGRLAMVEGLLGEAHFLAEEQREDRDYQEALGRIQRAEELRPGFPRYIMLRAFLHEKRGEYSEAEALYRRALDGMGKRADWMQGASLDQEPSQDLYFPDNYLATKHLGDVLLRQAEQVREADADSAMARRLSLEAAQAYREAIMTTLRKDHNSTTNGEVSSAAAVNNLGIALLRAGDYAGAVAVLDTLVRPPPDPDVSDEADRKEHGEIMQVLAGPYDVPEAWNENPSPRDPPLPEPDVLNPVFHLNLGWAHELNGNKYKAREHYIAAVRGDPSFYPALNDLGVLAAKGSRLAEARSYFGAALEAKPDYAHAAFNAGVALLQSGPRGFLAAQHFIARAVEQDPSLGETSYDFISDQEVYFLNLSLTGGVPSDWEFAARAERGAFYVSVGAVALLLWAIIRRTALDKGREALVGRLFDWGQARFSARLSRYWTWLRDAWLRLARPGWSTAGRWWATPLALLITAPAITLAEGWSLVWDDSVARLAMIMTLLYVALVSLLVHHAGHSLVAVRSRVRVRETPWLVGIAQAIALASLSGPFIAPMPATSVDGETGERERQLIYLAGPLATILFAVLLLILYATSHMPLFHFGAVLNLGLAAASLLALPPLEGAAVSDGYYTRWAFWAAIFVTVMSAVVALNGYF